MERLPTTPQTRERALPAHHPQDPLSLCEALQSQAGLFTYRLLTEQLILSFHRPRGEDGTRRFCPEPPRLLLQPLGGPAQSPAVLLTAGFQSRARSAQPRLREKAEKEARYVFSQKFYSA